MMGRNHAKQGVCVAGIGIAILAMINSNLLQYPSVALVSVFLVVCGSVFPDLDSSGSNASRSFGHVTAGLSAVIRAVTRLVYRLTRSPTERKGGGSHRLLTHTFLGCVAGGALLALLCSIGRIPAAVALGLLAGIGAFALSKKWKMPVAIIVGIAAYALPGVNTVWTPVWGIALALGCIVHCFGDSCTVSGTPFWWPLGRKGKRWEMRHVLPKRMRIVTGKIGEPIVMACTYVVVLGIISGLVVLRVYVL